MSTLKRKANTAADGSDAKKPKANTTISSFFAVTPKSTKSASSATASAGPKFDKEKWVAGLTAEQKKLLQLEIDTLDESWLAHLKDEITTKEFLDLKRFLDRETAAGKKWFPPAEDVYFWSRHTPFQNVKVVILGQDPYHNVNQAHGLAFSVRAPTPAPPSLRNMYIALKKDYPQFEAPPNRAGLLTTWADRGVLMLNTCLTVRAHEANSHSNRGWERFTQKIIELVAAKRPKGVVFLAWGSPAAKRVQKVDKVKHNVLNSVHPSPLSASRGFFDCGHFRKANEWLINRYGPEGEIDWALVPDNSTKEIVEKPKAVKVAKEVEKKAEKKEEDKENEISAEDEEALEEVLKQAEEELAAEKADS